MSGSTSRSELDQAGQARVEAEDAPVIDLQGIAHRFGSRWVLRGCSLSVAAGHAVALMGDNGAGKTTLLRIASTLLRPSRGEGRVFGHDLRREADAIREQVALFGYLPALYEDLTAEENLRFSCRMRGQPADPAVIARALDEVGLAAHADARVRGFSSGMRRRVSLARIVLQRPRLLLMDEPYAAFDDAGVELVNSLVQRVKADGGAVIAATHDLPRTSRIMDRVVRIEQGVLREAEAAAHLPGAPPAEGAGGTVRWREAAQCR